MIETGSTHAKLVMHASQKSAAALALAAVLKLALLRNATCGGLQCFGGFRCVRGIGTTSWSAEGTLRHSTTFFSNCICSQPPLACSSQDCDTGRAQASLEHLHQLVTPAPGHACKRALWCVVLPPPPRLTPHLVGYDPLLTAFLCCRRSITPTSSCVGSSPA